MDNLHNVKGIYKKLLGWKKNTRGLTSYEELPKEAKDYLSFIEQELGVPVAFISTGPARDEMIEKIPII